MNVGSYFAEDKKKKAAKDILKILDGLTIDEANEVFSVVKDIVLPRVAKINTDLAE